MCLTQAGCGLNWAELILCGLGFRTLLKMVIYAFDLQPIDIQNQLGLTARLPPLAIGRGVHGPGLLGPRHAQVRPT